MDSSEVEELKVELRGLTREETKITRELFSELCDSERPEGHSMLIEGYELDSMAMISLIDEVQDEVRRRPKNLLDLIRNN